MKEAFKPYASAGRQSRVHTARFPPVFQGFPGGLQRENDLMPILGKIGLEDSQE